MRVGEPRRALEDLNKAIELDPEPLTFFERSIVSRYLGDYEGALTDLDRSEKMIPEEWEDLGFGLLYQADCHARLGELDKALGCCARLPADFWTPGIDGAPAGDPPAIAERVKVLAAEARGGVSTRPPSE
jgi:tetratricopeptide (TPR) repeat protein